ncbi:hypothetical protein B566_EDAN004520 [Ephemera danica]|nr:hypothetical protein B566_EDAN004520 [Ephemera danica]
MAIPSIKLNTGYDIPALGLGTWKSKPGEVKTAVENAISAGYRHIDCAPLYENEGEVGQAIAAKIKDGTVTREQLFVTSKLWNTYHEPEAVEVACRQSLSDLGLTYLDLYLIHLPMGFKSWRYERLVQIECHPYLVQTTLSKACKDAGIAVTAYSPLSSPDRPWAKPGDPKLLEEPKVLAIAKNHGKSAAQILLRYQIERGHVTIPKTVSPSRLLENKNIFDFSLSPKEIASIESLDCGGRILVLELSHFAHHSRADKMQKIPNVKLNSGYDIPILGLGTWQLWCTYHEPEQVEVGCRQTMADLGLDYLDLYLIHFPIGFKQKSGSTSERDANNQIITTDCDYLDTWLAMEQLVKKGLVRSIGISNFNVAMLERILEKGIIPPATNQVECHPYLNQTAFRAAHKAKGVTITAYSPFANPNRAWAKPDEPKLMEDPKVVNVAKKHGKTPAQVLLRYQVECHPYLNQTAFRAAHKAKGVTITAYSPFANPNRAWAKPDEPKLMEDPKVVNVAKKHGKTPAQVLLRYQIQLGNITIPKSVTPTRLQENLQIFDFQLSDEEMASIGSLECNGRVGRMDFCRGHKYYPHDD